MADLFRLRHNHGTTIWCHTGLREGTYPYHPLPPMTSLFSHLILQPLLNLLIAIYYYTGFGDMGITIIIMTIGIRLLLLPLSLKSARSQQEMAALAPHLEEIKERHKNDTQAQSEAVMALYKERKVNPLGGCLPLLIQFPFLIGMYQVFVRVFKPESLALLYSFVPRPTELNTVFVGLIDMSHPNPVLAVMAGVFQFIQARILSANQPKNSPQAALNKQMMYLFPVMIVVISWQLPAGLALYWATTTLFSIGEQLYLRSRSGMLKAL
jgi:YidC/Oxa1 family membrane protein insertase